MPDLGIRTPLLDSFRAGEVPRDVRLLAARGGMAAQPLEQLALLALLVDDADVEIAAVATETLEAIPPDSLAAFLARADVPETLRVFFRARGVEPASLTGSGDTAPLLDRDEPLPQVDVSDEQTGSKMLALLPIVDRIKLAMKGTREQRALLVRDPNKIVATAVLSSPKLTEVEVESIARMTNVSDEVLRIIGANRSWVKSYAVIAALSRNPKTPVAISLQLLPRLNDRDVKQLATSRNVPEPVRSACQRMIAKAGSRRQ